MARQRIVRRVVPYVAVFVFSVVVNAGQAAGQSKPTPSVDFGKLADDYFVPLIADKSANAVAVVFTNRERVTFSKTYGPVDFDRSIWRAASVSKALTAIAVMRLVEEGTVDLDGDVNRYLKTFKIPATFQQPITLRQLLEHRSGLDDRFIGDGFRNGEQPPMRLLMQQVLPARVYAPSDVEFYSNYGYGLIGAVLEDVTGERFEDYMSANVLRPLKMNRSTFAQPLPQDLVSLVAPGKWWYQHAAPAGGVATTGADIAAFLIATLNEDASVISNSSFKVMTTPKSTNPGLVHRLGYWTGRDHGQQLIGASGDSGSFHSVIAAVPEHDLGVAVLVTGNGSGLAWGFYTRFLDAQFGTTSPQTPRDARLLQPKPADRESSSRFTGLYRTVRYPHHELSKTFIILDLTRVTADADGALRFRGARWIQNGPLQFEKEDGSETVSFKEDGGGRIQFLGDTDEKIGWYQSGYANIPFYFIFTIFFGVASWRARGVLRWLSLLALLHSLGWLSAALIRGPENLIFGLPLLLKGILSIGTAMPLLALAAIYVAWRNRTILAVATAAVLACYVPFVFYWNLRV
jgi:CubicO group peptidase (beta-lactamase class C family)